MTDSRNPIEDFIKGSHVVLNVLDGYFEPNKEASVPFKTFNDFVTKEMGVELNVDVIYTLVGLHYSVDYDNEVINGLGVKYSTEEEREKANQILDATGIWASIFLLQDPQGKVYIKDIKESLAKLNLDIPEITNKLIDTFDCAVGMFENVYDDKTKELIGFSGMKLKEYAE